MRAGLWISDSAGSARSVKPLHMKRTNNGSYSKCMKEGCIFDPNKGCENSIAVGAKPFPTRDSDCTWGMTQTGNPNPNRTERTKVAPNECLPSAYCTANTAYTKKTGGFYLDRKNKKGWIPEKQDVRCFLNTVNTAAIDDPVNHGRQCAFHKNDALTKCKAWDLCVGVICGEHTLGDYCLGKYNIYIYLFFFSF